MRFLHWFGAGVFIGILNILSYAVKKPLGVSSSYLAADALGMKAVGCPAIVDNDYLQEHSKVDYQLIMVIFMAIGGLVSAILFGRSRGKLIRSPADALTQIAGGFLMLFGARIAKGCTSGNILSGLAQMSLSSLLFTVTTFLAGAVIAKLTGGR